ncbi:thermopsin [Sulfodiicoccus acidiphilus]|uniref:Thermopsin n=1 Tax=Sulfodiicoccus acidiphilus TaxID=1670455 RepID=A0A348B429_9CREN|nr:thermopsin [Sulfodiicoccus acidiphilus]
MTFSVTSNATIDVLVMTSSQFHSFSNGIAAGVVFSSLGTHLDGDVGPFSGGLYYIIIDNNVSGQTAEVDLEYGGLPVDPFLYHSKLPAPIGIADYGILNTSRGLIPYVVKYSEAVGHFTVRSIGAYNATPPSGVSPYQASLQMNVVLQVNTQHGSFQYWLQDVVDFYTNNDTYNVIDNVWNSSSYPSLLTNSSVKGGGAVYIYNNQSYYAFGTQNYHYSMPFSGSLLIREQQTNSGVLVSFGFYNGSLSWFDNVTIIQPGVSSSYMLVDGYNFTGSKNYYDAELVFGGGGNGEITDFTSMNSTLGMEYVLTNGTYAAPRELYGFGSDTAEAADDLTTYLRDGVPSVSLGVENLYSPLFYVPSPLNIRLNLTYQRLDAGQPINATLSGTMHGGLLPYTFYLYLNGTPVLNFTSFGTQVIRYLELGSLIQGVYRLTVVVEAANGQNSTFSYLITVEPDPQLSLTAKASKLDAGQALSLSLSASGGTSPYQLTLYVNGKPYGQVQLGTFAVTFQGSGTYEVWAVLRDAAGFLTNSTVLTVTVDPDPTLTLVASRTTTDYGLPLPLRADVTGGTPPYQYRWDVDGKYVSSSNVLNFTAPVGNYTITLFVTDQSNYTISYTLNVTVNPDPVLRLVYSTGSAGLLYTGNLVNLTASISGGTPPYVYMWTVDGAVAANTTSPSYVFHLKGPGSYSLGVSVRDAATYVTTKSISSTVGYNLATLGIGAVVVIALAVGIGVAFRRR